jgi:DNA-binding response OmpR family regulator
LASVNDARVKVLVVEDDVEAAAALALTLMSCGYECRVASDAAGAVVVARTFVPDVVVLDLGLPDRDGEDLAQELRATLPMRAPIVVVTGRPEPQPETLRAIDVVMRKPIEGKLFMSLISCARAKRASLRD